MEKVHQKNLLFASKEASRKVGYYAVVQNLQACWYRQMPAETTTFYMRFWGQEEGAVAWQKCDMERAICKLIFCFQDQQDFKTGKKFF